MTSKRRKLSAKAVSAAALCILVFAALPALASAARVESPAGTLIKVGTPVTLKSSNVVMQYQSGTLTCENWEFYGVVNQNSGTVVEVGPYGEPSGKAEGCRLAGAQVAYQVSLSSIKLSPAGQTASFQWHGSSGFTEYTTSTITYSSPATKIHIEGQFSGTQAGIFKGDFTGKVQSSGKAIVFN